MAVFGSVARGEARTTSDVDLLIELAPSHRVGLFGLSRLKRRLADIVPRADVVDNRSLHPAVAARSRRMPFMPSDRDRRWLEDIADNIRIVEDAVSRTDREGFSRDVVVRYAVTYALMSISAAARRLSPEIKKQHSSIGWRDVEDAGNAYRHEYHRLDTDLLWETATTELTALKKAVTRALAESRR